MRRPARLPFVTPALAIVAGCGIAFSPGDYSAPGEATTLPDGATTTAENDGGVTVDAGGVEASAETGVTTPSRHIVVFAGTKAPSGDTNDVLLFPAAADGTLGPSGYLQSTPLVKPLQAVGLVTGRLLAVAQGTSSRVVQSTDFANDVTIGWTTAVVPNPPTTSYGSFFAKSSLVVVGGQTTEEVDDGNGGTTTVTTNHDELYVNKASGAQYPQPNNVVSATKLPVGLFQPTSVVYKDFVYLWGSGAATDQRSKVYVGKADETLGLASVTATAPIVGQDGKAHTPTAPMACAGEGRLFVIGGAGSAVVVSADIDEATGALGTWKSGPNLPAARNAGACAVVNGSVYVFGGTTPITDEILRSKISSDGTLGEWEITAQRLKAARANLFALTY